MSNYSKARELYHHGVKGQKWGVRRFEDAARESEKIASKAQIFTQETRGSKAIRKNYSNISNEELQKRITRLNLERSYGDLTGDTKYVQTGKEKAREWLQTIGALLGITASAVAIYRALHGDKNEVE